MQEKQIEMDQAVALISDGQMVAVGGNALHRTPTDFCHYLALAGRRNLAGVGAAPGYALDVLCAAEAVTEVFFGFFGFENEYGLAPGMRKGMQGGKIRAVEGS